MAPVEMRIAFNGSKFTWMRSRELAWNRANSWWKPSAGRPRFITFCRRGSMCTNYLSGTTHPIISPNSSASGPSPPTVWRHWGMEALPSANWRNSVPSWTGVRRSIRKSNPAWNISREFWCSGDLHIWRHLIVRSRTGHVTSLLCPLRYVMFVWHHLTALIYVTSHHCHVTCVTSHHCHVTCVTSHHCYVTCVTSHHCLVYYMMLLS